MTRKAKTPSPTLIHHQLTLHGSWVTSVGDMADLLEFLASVFMQDHKPLNAAISLKKAEAFRPP